MLIDGVEYTDKQILEAAELFPYTFVKQHGIKTSNGLPFEFEDHRFLKDMINDMSPLQVWLKPPQIGASECEIIKSFYIAKKLHKDIIYTLPTATDRDDMVGSKVNRIIAQNPVFQKWVRDHDTVEQKSVGSNIIHYRGTFAAKQAMMVSSQLNIHDEVDASDPGVITQYETRLQAVADGWRWYFSHPSLVGHGVDIYWQQSDKREWHITCPHCTHEQVLTWPLNIDLVREIYICSRCREELPDSVRRQGTWKPTAEGIFRGYHVSQLMCAWISAERIIEAYNDKGKTKQYFWNYVLGLPYVGSDDVISADVVLKNCKDEVNEQHDTIVIGVDTGLPIHFSLMNRQGVFYYGTCEPETEREKALLSKGLYDPYDRLRAFLRRWPRSKLVSDQGGDLIGIRKLQQEFPGRVFLCFYRKDKKTTEIIQWGTKEKYGEVYVDRNKMIQLLVEHLREPGLITLNGTREEWTEWAMHFDNIYREKIVVNDLPEHDDRTLYGAEYVWKRKGADHYVHTLVYGQVGLDKYGQSLAKIVGDTGMEGVRMARIVTDIPSMNDPQTIRPSPSLGFAAGEFGSGNHVDF
jgi:hypothetical protein